MTKYERQDTPEARDKNLAVAAELLERLKLGLTKIMDPLDAEVLKVELEKLVKLVDEYC